MLVRPSWKTRLWAAGLSLAVAGCGGKSDDSSDGGEVGTADSAVPGGEMAAPLSQDPVAAAPAPAPPAAAPAGAGSTQEMLAMANQAPAVQTAPAAAAPGEGAGNPGVPQGYESSGYGMAMAPPPGGGGRPGLSAEGEGGAPPGYGPAPGQASGGGPGAPGIMAPDSPPGEPGMAPPGAGGYGQSAPPGAIDPAAGGIRGAMGPGYGQGPSGIPGAPSGEGGGEGYGPAFGGNPEIPGNPGGGGGMGGDAKPNYRNPMEAVRTFLDAVKSKNLERIADATALRSPTEANPKNQKFFKAILEQSIDTEQINDLASELDGMNVVSMNQAKETAKIGVTIGKQQERESITRTVIVRREKAGWKVLDIEAKRVYTAPGGRRR